MQTRTISSCWSQFPHIQPFQRICPPSSPADSIPMQLCQDFGLPKLHGNHISSSTFGSEICVLLEKKTVSPDFGLFTIFTWCILVHKKPSGTLEHFSHLSILTNPSLPVPNQKKSGRSEGVSHVLRPDHHLYTWHFPNPSHSRLQWWWPLFLLRLWSSHHGPVEAPPTPPRLGKNTSS